MFHLSAMTWVAVAIVFGFWLVAEAIEDGFNLLAKKLERTNDVLEEAHRP